MEILKSKIRKELRNLYKEGVEIFLAEIDKRKNSGEKDDEKNTKKKRPSLKMDYQSWYSKSLPVIKQLLPDRYQEFTEQYKLEKRKEIDFLTYTISDYLINLTITRPGFTGEVVDSFAAFSTKFQHQLTILNSANDRIDSLLSNIEGVLQSELFDNELNSAEELLRKNHIRASGALAGVTLEAHLSAVSINHGIKLRKKNPSIADYNDEIKKNGLIDVPQWRFIQRLGDIRNLCVHSKERDPTSDEVKELIDGVSKVITTLF